MAGRSTKARADSMRHAMAAFLIMSNCVATIAAAPTITAPARASSVYAPLQASIETLAVSPAEDGGFPVRLHLRVTDANPKKAHRVHVELLGSGVVQLGIEQPGRFDLVIDEPEKTMPVALLIAAAGDGFLRVRASELDDAGDSRWGAAATIFVLRTPDDFVTGRSSILELSREKLRRDLQSGRIDEQQFRQQQRHLLDGGKLDLGR